MPVPPEHIAPPRFCGLPLQSLFGVIVTRFGNSGAGATVIVDVVTVPTESCTVMVTIVLSATSFGTSSTVLPETTCATGSTAELLEKAKYGPMPPVTASVAGVLA